MVGLTEACAFLPRRFGAASESSSSRTAVCLVRRARLRGGGAVVDSGTGGSTEGSLGAEALVPFVVPALVLVGAGAAGFAVTLGGILEDVAAMVFLEGAAAATFDGDAADVLLEPAVPEGAGPNGITTVGFDL